MRHETIEGLESAHVAALSRLPFKTFALPTRRTGPPPSREREKEKRPITRDDTITTTTKAGARLTQGRVESKRPLVRRDAMRGAYSRIDYERMSLLLLLSRLEKREREIVSRPDNFPVPRAARFYVCKLIRGRQRQQRLFGRTSATIDRKKGERVIRKFALVTHAQFSQTNTCSILGNICVGSPTHL